MELHKIIEDKIHNSGPVSFRDFMEMALYYPAKGYYTSGDRQIGFSGDFFTSCTLSPVFGYLLAKQVQQMREIMGLEKFCVVEYGAGTGELAHSILNWFDGAGVEPPEYYIIEISPGLRDRQRLLLSNKAKWINDISEIENFKGCVIANEVADNFPVHRVVMDDELMEVFVDYNNGFQEILRPAGDELKEYFRDLRVELPKGFRTEVNLQASLWAQDIGNSMASGYFMCIDYGFTSGEYYSPARRNGTLMCFSKHGTNQNFYQNIGNQDITSHVNFSALALAASKNGFEFSGFRDQGPFLRALGFFEEISKMRDESNYAASVKKENLVSNTLLNDMGSKFKVMVLKKGVSNTPLIGFRVQQD